MTSDEMLMWRTGDRVCADLLYAFSSVRRGLSFIDHRMDSGGAEAVVVDQNLLQSTNAEISFSSGQRAKPDAFELFRGRLPVGVHVISRTGHSLTN
jgi:hypothetical protein